MIQKMKYLFLSLLLCFQVSFGAKICDPRILVATLLGTSFFIVVTLIMPPDKVYQNYREVLKKHQLHEEDLYKLAPFLTATGHYKHQVMLQFEQGYILGESSCNKKSEKLFNSDIDPLTARTIAGNNACHALDIPSCSLSLQELLNGKVSSFVAGALHGNNACHAKKMKHQFKKTSQPQCNWNKSKCFDPRFSGRRRKK